MRTLPHSLATPGATCPVVALEPSLLAVLPPPLPELWAAVVCPEVALALSPLLVEVAPPLPELWAALVVSLAVAVLPSGVLPAHAMTSKPMAMPKVLSMPGSLPYARGELVMGPAEFGKLGRVRSLGVRDSAHSTHPRRTCLETPFDKAEFGAAGGEFWRALKLLVGMACVAEPGVQRAARCGDP